METQTETEVRLMEDKMRIMKTRIDNTEYFRKVCGGYSGPTEEELEIEKSKLEGLYEKRRKEREPEERIKRKEQETEKYLAGYAMHKDEYKRRSHEAMCNGVPVW